MTVMIVYECTDDECVMTESWPVRGVVLQCSVCAQDGIKSPMREAREIDTSWPEWLDKDDP